LCSFYRRSEFYEKEERERGRGKERERERERERKRTDDASKAQEPFATKKTRLRIQPRD